MDQKEDRMPPGLMDEPLPVVFFLLMPVYIIGILGVFLFPISGDWRWLEAWLFVVTLTLSLMIGMLIISQRNPRVIRNRMKMRKRGLTAATRESASSDRWIMPVMGIAFYAALILPAVSRRLGWESFPF